jgi:AcrR family transcriptional regulator
MKKKAATDDPAHRLAVLWGSHSEAGRSGLTIKAIVVAAIAIADTEGIDALSMRYVAEKLSIGTMSLYTHIQSKTELIELMIDSAWSELYTSVDEPSQQGDWRQALRFIAQRNWSLYRTHPWMLQFALGRPVLGPHTTLKYEAELRPLDQIGLGDVEMAATLALVLAHVAACARAQVTLAQSQRETNMGETEWWLTHSSFMEKIIDSTHFPVGARVGMAAGQAYGGASSPEFALAFGLERILAGIAELITHAS